MTPFADAPFHIVGYSRYTGAMRRTSFTLGLLAIITIAWPLSAMAQTGRSDWDASDHSRVRLLLLRWAGDIAVGEDCLGPCSAN